MDVKRDDDVSRGDESAGASTIATKSKTLISADESRTAASDANDLPVPIDPSLDERTGPNALPIAKRVADVVGQTPTAIERLSMPAWPASRPADGEFIFNLRMGNLIDVVFCLQATLTVPTES
jgi:hypothetical protein